MENTKKTPDLSGSFGDSHAKKTSLEFNEKKDLEQEKTKEKTQVETKNIENHTEHSRDGFENLDKQYKHELELARHLIISRWEVKYDNTQPMGEGEFLEKALQQMDKDKRSGIENDFAEAQTKIEQFHFEGRRRDDVYKELLAREKVEAQKALENDMFKSAVKKSSIQEMIQNEYPDSKAQTMADLMKEMSAKLDMKTEQGNNKSKSM